MTTESRDFSSWKSRVWQSKKKNNMRSILHKITNRLSFRGFKSSPVNCIATIHIAVLDWTSCLESIVKPSFSRSLNNIFTLNCLFITIYSFWWFAFNTINFINKIFHLDFSSCIIFMRRFQLMELFLSITR